jgi:hypothetical protein
MWYMIQVVHVEKKSSAPREHVFALLADVTTWPTWTEFDEGELLQPGTPDRNGVGAIRAFRRKRVRSREEVVAFEAPSHLAYRLLEGLPIKGYRADVTLAETPEGGTAITWHSTFRPTWPGTGWLIRRGLSKFIAQTAADLAAAAEKHPVTH